MMTGQPKFTVGIDLGTTHCAVSFSEQPVTRDDTPLLQPLMIPQLSAPGKIEYKNQLPSFIYLPREADMSLDEVSLPWDHHELLAVGEYARERAADSPKRVVASAKSWLCQENIDKRAGILPPYAEKDIEAFSPLQATIYYLEHIRKAWDYSFPDNPLSQQQITLTIPASFDPSSRELTAEAARLCDYENLTLLEEPQAAFYSWLHRMGEDWKEYISVGDVVLVVDVGGGTCDFSLILVTEQNKQIEIQRVAVGNHILVGGDNMDLMLAHIINSRLTKNGQPLDPWQIQALTQSARQAKEKLLANNSLEHISVVIPGRTSKLIGRAIKEQVTREDVTQAVLEGFFPFVDSDSTPAQKPRSGITRVGLNYAQDPAITRHIAAFLRQHRHTLEQTGLAPAQQADFATPSAVLFNGGVFKSKLLRERVLAVINRWLDHAQLAQIRELPGADYDNAVALGAGLYGHVQNGSSMRIKGGTAQAYYIGLESPAPAVPGFEPPIEALCIAPFGMEEGTTLELRSQEFGLIIGEEVTFRFFGSTVRREDTLGTVLSQWEEGELVELHNVEVMLESQNHNKGEVVNVYLSATQTEIGTLVLKAHAANSSNVWDIEFNIRENQTEFSL